MNKRFNIYNSSFEEFLQIKEKLWQNIREVELSQSTSYIYGLPSLDNLTYQRIDTLLENKTLNENNFREQWACEIVAIHWNNEPFGLEYDKLKEQYKKISENPASMETLKELYVQGNNSRYNHHFQRTRVAIKEDRFLTFWEWVCANDDTKGPWRHWWDAVRNENKYKTGNMVEFRSNTNNNHVYQLYIHPYNKDYKYLRCITNSQMKDIKSKVFIILGYDKHLPKKTYSYKKSQGSHRLVTILPIGSTETYFIPEQFVKISRKKAVKDAKK